MNSNSTAERWNERYTNQSDSFAAPVRKLLSDHRNLIPPNGFALEIAGGIGVTSDYLQNAGMQVFEIDISFQALRRAAKLNPEVIQITADANYLPLSGTRFDLICNFYFFDRCVIPSIKSLLKPGGIVFIETLTKEMLSIRPEIPPEYLLSANELRTHFSDFDILHYFEGWITSDHGKQKSIGSLIARKPLNSV
jgi:tellurite methyltransferase